MGADIHIGELNGSYGTRFREASTKGDMFLIMMCLVFALIPHPNNKTHLVLNLPSNQTH